MTIRRSFPLHTRVEVTWNDSWAGDRWESTTDYDKTCEPISTLGYYVEQDKTWLYIAQSYSESEYGSLWRIPVGCLISIEAV